MSRQPISDGDGPSWLTAGLEPSALRRYSEALTYPDSASGLDALARAVSSSLRLDGPVRAVRAPRKPPPRLALLVEAGAAAQAEVSAQLKTLERVCGQLRFVDYPAADVIAADLARRLEDRLGDELSGYRLTAIPRGGWLVAGMVAAHLHLPLAPAAGETAAGTLIVDDCALTGVAFGRLARRLGGGPLVFAPLLAPRGLAREIEHASGVEAVVIGAELAETGESSPREYEAWRRRWRSRLMDPPYWLGLTEFPCFPWNEPKRWIWNPVSETAAPAWRVLAAERCLDGRHELAVDTEAPGREAFRVGGEVVAAETDDVVYVADLASGGSWRLEGAGAVMWRALTSRGGRERAVAEVVERFSVTADVAASDLDRWLTELIAKGLLEER